MKLYSVYDIVAKKFNAPFLAENNEVANRSFQLGLKDNAFAKDFDLYCVGDFELTPDDLTCNVIQAFVPSFVSHFVGEVVENA